MISLLSALNDPNLFLPHFQGKSWDPWKTFLRVLFAEPLEPSEKTFYQECTGRRSLPTKPFREAWCVVGRRGGKSRLAALIATYMSTFRSYDLARGERATVAVISSDRKQSRVCLGYIKGLIRDTPLLASLVERETADGLDLSNGVTVETHTSSYKSIRGYSLACVVADEISFWQNDLGTNPAEEILNAIRPGLMSIEGSLLICITSPYSKKGVTWETYRRHFGHDDSNVLVWQSPSLRMNPSLDPGLVEEALREDPSRASAEYLGQFRSDIEGLFTPTALDAAITPGVYERSWQPNVYTYTAHCDPSGGARDSFCLSIAHSEGDRLILDCVREIRAPCSPDRACAELAQVLAEYRLSAVGGDKYASGFAVDAWARQNIGYRPSELTTSELYLRLLAHVNSGRVSLLDNDRLRNQLLGLERNTSRAGRDLISHPLGSFDDLATSAAGAIVNAKTARPIDPNEFVFGEPYSVEEAAILSGSGVETEHVSLLDF
jgi:hypothetical protein